MALACRFSRSYISESYTGASSFDDAMSGYQQQRDEAVTPMFELTLQFAAMQPPPPEMQALLGAVHGNPAAKGSTDAEEHEEDKAFEHGYLHSDVRKSAGGHSASRRTKAILPAPAAGLEKMRREVRRSCRIVPA